MKRGRSYDWIPLWIDKWLLGSTRFELDPGERSVFMDLMVMAAKDDGFIRANDKIGYPHEWLSRSLNVPRDLLDKAIERCIEFRKITDKGSGIYYVTNWEEYRLSGSYKRALTLGIKDIPGSKETETVPKETVTVSPSMYKSKSSCISFKGRVWAGILAEDMEAWAKAYPACDLKSEFAKMGEWLLANPTKAVKSNWRRFIVNWLSRSQDRGGSAASNRVEHKVSQIGTAGKEDHGSDYWAEVRLMKERGLEGEALTEAMAKWEAERCAGKEEVG